MVCVVRQAGKDNGDPSLGPRCPSREERVFDAGLLLLHLGFGSFGPARPCRTWRGMLFMGQRYRSLNPIHSMPSSFWQNRLRTSDRAIVCEYEHLCVWRLRAYLFAAR
jgi:hypothetical protein